MAVIGCWKNSFPAQIHTATFHNCSQMWLVSTHRDVCLISTWASDNGEKTNKTTKARNLSPSQRSFDSLNVSSLKYPLCTLTSFCFLPSLLAPVWRVSSLKWWRSPLWFHILSLLPPQCISLSPTFHSGNASGFLHVCPWHLAHLCGRVITLHCPCLAGSSSPLLRGGLKARDWVLSITATPEPCIIIIHTNRIHTQ